MTSQGAQGRAPAKEQALQYLFCGISGLFFMSLKTPLTWVARYSHFFKDRH